MKPLWYISCDIYIYIYILYILFLLPSNNIGTKIDRNKYPIHFVTDISQFDLDHEAKRVLAKSFKNKSIKKRIDRELLRW